VAALAKPESAPVESDVAVEQTPAAEEEVIIKHQLDDTEIEKEDLGGLGLVPTTDELRNLDVVYEEVKPEVIAAEVPSETLETELDQAVSEEEFVIIETSEQLRDIDVVEPEEVLNREELEQTALAFELPLVVDNPVEEEEEIVAEDEAPTITFDLSDESMSMEEEAYIEVDEIVETPPLESSETRFDLQDYMELEKQLAGAQPAEEKETAVADEPVLKRIDQETEASTGDPQGEVAAEENPFENSIDEILKERVDDRRKKMKDFNHKFSFRRNSIEDIEKEPAYKRQGVDLGDVPKEQKVSRTSLSEDSNEDMQLRSNNSFLHDNVD
jgi:cell division protein FtsZ